MRGYLLDLDFLEAANTLMQTLLDVALKDLLAGCVLLYEFWRIFGAVKGETERYFVGVADLIAL